MPAPMTTTRAVAGTVAMGSSPLQVLRMTQPVASYGTTPVSTVGLPAPSRDGRASPPGPSGRRRAQGPTEWYGRRAADGPPSREGSVASNVSSRSAFISETHMPIRISMNGPATMITSVWSAQARRHTAAPRHGTGRDAPEDHQRAVRLLLAVLAEHPHHDRGRVGAGDEEDRDQEDRQGHRDRSTAGTRAACRTGPPRGILRCRSSAGQPWLSWRSNAEPPRIENQTNDTGSAPGSRR